MAQQQGSGPGGARRFDKGLNEDVNDFHLPDNQWTHARNAINNSRTGDLGKLGNEPSNLLCAEVKDVNTGLPLDIIGAVHFIADRWVIFSTNDVTSEIGVFVEDSCTYTPIVNANCLNFNKKFLIKGVARSFTNCNYRVYWDDGNNPSRYLEFNGDEPQLNVYTNPNSPIPWITDCGYGPGVPPPLNVACPDCENTPDLNCNLIRLSPFITTPCIRVSKGIGSGTLLNGSYMVAIAYTIDNQKVTDYYTSNIQPLFSHFDGSSSLEIDFGNLDTTFQEMQVVVVSVVAQQVVARQAGIYSTRQRSINLDLIDLKWPVVPIENIPIMTPIPYRTDAMYTINDYLLRSGVLSKEDFNYQPLANQIVAKWQSIEYPIDYYRKGGNKTNYLRDEVYAFFIQWIYDTGDKSNAYHIPGRSFFYNSAQGPTGSNSEKALVTSDVFADEIADGINYKWYADNTAYQTQFFTPGVNAPVTDDGGFIVAEGYMGYWESSELYPDNKPQVWNAANNPLAPGFNATINPYQAVTPPGLPNAVTDLTELDLCGKPIRHHKFPELNTSVQTRYTNSGTAAAPNFPTAIRILGAKFENIKPPVLNDGVTPVPGIVGYEILRGTRSGNKTILAKGIINNTRTYTNPDGSASSPLSYFPNYPYNELRPDPFLTKTQILGSSCTISGAVSGLSGNIASLYGYSQQLFTFHSPDTNFTNPYLSAKEVKIAGEVNGDVTGKYELSEEHPKAKILTNFAFLIACIGGIGLTVIDITGRKKTKYIKPKNPGYSFGAIAGSSSSLGAPSSLDLVAYPIMTQAVGVVESIQTGFQTAGSGLIYSLIGGNWDDFEYPTALSSYGIIEGVANTAGLGFNTAESEQETEDSDTGNTPFALRVFNGTPLFLSKLTKYTNEILDFLKVTIPYRNYALRYHSHCFYNRYINSTPFGARRHQLSDAQYIGPQISNFNNNIRINNLYRPKTVAILTNTAIADPALEDVTRLPASVVPDLFEKENANQNSFIGIEVLKNPNRASFGAYTNYQFPWLGNLQFITPGNAPGVLAANGYSVGNHSGVQVASSHYVSLKQRVRNLYGQLNGITIVPASYCSYPAPAPGQTTSTSSVFGGDTYVTRYTEKNTFFYFYDWLYGQPDGAQFDYKKHIMIPYPRYWANLEQFEMGDFISSLANLLDPSQWASSFSGGVYSTLVVPSNFYNLDGDVGCFASVFAAMSGAASSFRLSVRYQWFYLFNSGIRDFVCESEYNCDLRDWGEISEQEHYDAYRYTDTKELFNTKIIKFGNFYKYDQSLSLSRLFINYASWATMQARVYDPYIAETCYTQNPTQIIYSLPADYESLYDGWRTFLTNNYYNFPSIVTGVRSVNKSGAIFFMEDVSPLMFQGLDQLQTTAGTSLTIGDGELFSQPSQNIVNTEASFEYASCQDPFSIINTPAGLFWISENQGKIFNYSSGLSEVSMQDMKWWLINYLPYKLTEDFPDFELTKNTVIGIGCQSIYDNQNGLVYFSKRDFELRKDLEEGITVSYISGDDFEVYNPDIGRFNIKLGNPNFFQDASWTISYDPKTKNWVSYHDWHPNLEMPGKNTFLTVKGNSIWLHNYRTDSYCNYYGTDYPWEVEYLVDTGAQVNTLRSIEYQLECYKYAQNMYDRFHVLDFNFDEAVVYNTEQTSGLLSLNLTPKNDPMKIIQYPKIGGGFIEILYSKEENRYRFNQFWDVTADRGEYNLNAERVIFNTEANGYVRNLNLNNLDYTKAPFQRKKFRHYLNYVFLRKKVCGDRKMLILVATNKNLYSPR